MIKILVGMCGDLLILGCSRQASPVGSLLIKPAPFQIWSGLPFEFHLVNSSVFKLAIGI